MLLYIAIILIIVAQASDSSALYRHHLNKKIQFERRSSKLAHDNEYQELSFTQKLDHFDLTLGTTWQQRYFINQQFYKSGGPVFLQIGGEGEANPIWMTNGHWVLLAQQFGALCLMLEHRYYGKSHPTKDMSTENLKWLSSEQALADLASFVSVTTEQLGLPAGTRWISFGGSYPGSLSAWFRLKYPHLVFAAVSSSAPLLAQIDFKEYQGVVRDSLNTVSRACTEAVANGTKQLSDWIDAGINLDKIKQQFLLCDDLDATNAADVNNLFVNLAGNFDDVVQYNKDNREFEGVPGTNITMDTLCSMMTSSKRSRAAADPVAGLAAINRILLNVSNKTCLDFKYDKMIAGLTNVSWESSAGAGGRQWNYQSCTEFGFFQSSDLVDQPFGSKFPLSFWLAQCKDIFGPNFTPQLLQSGVNETNINYGAKRLRATRVILVNGSIDPWHWLGVTNGSTLDPMDDNHVIYIDGTAHCANMYPATQTDPPQLRKARKLIEDILSTWLQL